MDVRQFHIYANVGAPPETTQIFRIASMPPDHPTFLDRSLTLGAEIHYAVTAVDYQGNESDPVEASISM